MIYLQKEKEIIIIEYKLQTYLNNLKFQFILNIHLTPLFFLFIDFIFSQFYTLLSILAFIIIIYIFIIT